MSLHKSVDLPYQPPGAAAAKEWRFAWPNASDFTFNYYRLLDTKDGNNFAQSKKGQKLRIAVIGAGVAGLTAARELFRSGYTHIDIYEASERIGGRTYSIKAEGQDTAYEMGAMRMPFFPAPGKKNSVLDYYRQLYGIATQPFPNPGSTVVKTTGIYLNEGYGPDPDPANPPPPEMLLWQGGTAPPDPALKEVYDIWNDFVNMTTPVLQKEYGKSREEWTAFWQSMIGNYWNKNFRELSYMPRIKKYDPAKPGFFGGLGMTQKQSALFYTIGAGDGSWGAFYDISCLYVIRTLLFGFGTDHQLIQGLFGKKGAYTPGPEHDGHPLDSHGKPLAPPAYIGVQSFAECMFYMPVQSDNKSNGVSLYDALSRREFEVRLWTDTPVKRVSKQPDGSILIASRHPGMQEDTQMHYDAVILTVPTWAIELSMGTDFPLTEVPLDVTQSIRNSHWISSCKVFFPLKERYWEKGVIPQIIATDTYLQGVYAYAVDSKNSNPGVLLASYTWEDGANKFLPNMDKKSLANLCLQKLDEILLRCKNIGQPVSRYIDTSKDPVVIQWSEQATYRGCAKLYRETSWIEDYSLLTYNQKYSAKSQLYFAGEGFSVQGGWTEPALRGALDAVVYLVKNNGGEFRGGFKFSDYPQYEYKDPDNPYPCSTDRLALFGAQDGVKGGRK